MYKRQGLSQSIPFTVKNIPDEIPEEETINTQLDLTINAQQYPATASIETVEDAANVTLYEAKPLNDIQVYNGYGDSTANAEMADGIGTTTTDNGQYPYQIFEIDTCLLYTSGYSAAVFNSQPDSEYSKYVKTSNDGSVIFFADNANACLL